MGEELKAVLERREQMAPDTYRVGLATTDITPPVGIKLSGFAARTEPSTGIYRPLEASIRWAGLLRYEQVILASVSSPMNLPQSLDCPRLGELRLYTDRIYDLEDTLATSRNNEPLR